MTVIFDAEPLLAFAFDEQGAGTVEHWLDRVYDGDIDGYIATITLTEFRYVAARNASLEAADTYIDNLRRLGVTEYHIDELWDVASELKARYSPALGDAYLDTARESRRRRRSRRLPVASPTPRCSRR